MSWAVFDLETTTHTAFKRKADPFHQDNWVVMAGWCTQAAPSPRGLRNKGKESEEWGWLIALLEDPGTKFLVGQNIKFDVLYACRDAAVYRAWQDFVVRGGLVWDCQLAEYLLQGQIKAAHMLSMDEMAEMYGLDLKVDEVKKLWEAGVATEDIDPDLLADYLLGRDLFDEHGVKCGRREGDIGNTRDIFLKQVAIAKARGQSRSILWNMGALIASIEMERNGMYVDQKLGHELAKDLAARLKVAKEELEKYIPADFPLQFVWTNRYHLSPLIFGGRIKYERRQYDLKDGTTTWTPPKPEGDPLYAYSQKDTEHYVLADGTTMEVLWWEHCDATEWATGRPEGKDRVEYKSGKQAGQVKTKKVKADDYTKPKGRMADDYYVLPGYTKPKKEWESSTEGLWSVSSEVIEDLTERTDIPFLQQLGKVTAMSKDLGTYFITTDEKGESKGMLTLVRENGIVHHSINHTNTVTGRLSSANPNLQNIPKGNKSAAKQMFTSRYKDGVIIQSDFSSLEIYVQAMLTGSKNLILDLLNKIDLHCMRLSYVEDMEYTEVFKLCKGWEETRQGEVIYHAAVEEWDYKRTGAKEFSFQRAYGAGVPAIAKTTGLSVDVVQKLADAEELRYPEIKQHFDKRAEEIAENAQPTANWVRHPCNAAVPVQIHLSRIQMPTGKLYSFYSSPSLEFMFKKGILQSFSPTERKNYEVQGEGGEVMKGAMWLAVREFYRLRNFSGLSVLVNTVHDAQYADSCITVRNDVAKVLHACMEAASDLYCWWFKLQVPLPVPSDTVWGANMGEENKFKSPEFFAAAAEHRTYLRNQYMQGFVPSYQTLE